MLLSVDVITALESAGVVIAGTTGFAGDAADADGDGILTAIDTGGPSGVRTHDRAGRDQYERPTCQVAVRHTSLAAAAALIDRAYNALADIRHRTIGGSRYVELRPLQRPINIGRDSASRARLVFNVQALRSQ